MLFLVPVGVPKCATFWAVADPSAAKFQQVMFMKKNISMLGAALMIAYFGVRAVQPQSGEITERYYETGRRGNSLPRLPITEYFDRL